MNPASSVQPAFKRTANVSDSGILSIPFRSSLSVCVCAVLLTLASAFASKAAGSGEFWTNLMVPPGDADRQVLSGDRPARSRHDDFLQGPFVHVARVGMDGNAVEGGEYRCGHGRYRARMRTPVLQTRRQ